MDFYFLFIYFQPPSPQSPTVAQTTPIQPPPKQYTSLQIVSSLTIHPFINELMSNGIVKPLLHTQNYSTVSSLSPVLVPPPMWSTARSDFQLREQTVNRLNYKCGILTPFPRVAPLPVSHPPPCHSGASFGYHAVNILIAIWTKSVCPIPQKDWFILRAQNTILY